MRSALRRSGVRSWWPAVLTVLIAGCVAGILIPRGHEAHAPGGRAHNGRPVPAELTPEPPETRFAPGWHNGVALPGLSSLATFERRTGERPSIIAVYSNLAAPFPAGQLATIMKAGALPLIQLNPRGISLQAVVDGRFDRQLAYDQRVIAATRRPVAVSFAHEMNGTWDAWGCHHVRPALYRAAWIYVEDHLRGRIIWVWNPNKLGKGTCPLGEWYPGSRYVTWVGLDGYLRSAGESWQATFGRTLRAVARLAPGKPVLFAETGTPSAAGPGLLRSLYRHARAAGAIGLVWFDSATRKGNYEPYATPRFLEAFKREVAP